MRVYTYKLLNLGVHSTQRHESYHVVVKKELNPHLQLSDAIRELITHVNRLCAKYNERINDDRRHLPRIIDMQTATITVVSSLISRSLRHKTSRG